MKALKYLIASLVLFLAVWSCTDEEFGSTDFVETATAPANLTALFDITTDNTGLVTITPNGEGANFFDVAFGDNSTESASLKLGESVEHTYAEGSYEMKLTGYGITGLETEQIVPLMVSFKAPENLEVTITNDEAVSKKVNVIATADYALAYDVYFGEEGNDVPVTANIGEIASYVYQEAGTYTIRVVAKSAAIETVELSQEFDAVAILQPIKSAPVPPVRGENDVISIFSGAYADVPGSDYFPDWGQAGNGSGWAMFELDGDEMLNYTTLSYQGIQIGEAQDLSTMEYLHMDIWTADLPQIRTFLINLGVDPPENVLSDLTVDEWTSLEIPMSAFTDQGVAIDNVHQFKFVSEPYLGGSVFIDNIYFWKEPSGASVLEGSWMMAPEAGAIGVGPGPGDYSWWSSSADDVNTRACFFDDEYVFGTDGSFANVLGAETWVEGWQITDFEGCNAPVAPHDGTNPATFTNTESTVTVTGLGAYLGIPKVHNAGEDGSPANNTITYNYVLSPDGNTLELTVPGYGGTGGSEEWYFKLVRTDGPVSPPFDDGLLTNGDFENGAAPWTIGVGPDPAPVVTVGDNSYYSVDVPTAGNAYDVNVSQKLEIIEDETYTLSFDAWSDTNRPILAGLGLSADPWTNIVETVNITTDRKTYSVIVTATGFGASDARAFFDLGAAVGSVNIDNVSLFVGGGGTTPPFTGPSNTPIDFEAGGNGADWSWEVFENGDNPPLEFINNPYKSGANTSERVVKFSALDAGQPWIGTVSGDIEKFTLDATNKVVRIMVYKTVISDVGIKFESNKASTGEIKVANTKINEWEELVFDFSGKLGEVESTDIDAIVVFPDFTDRAGDHIIYFDNITFGSN